MLAPYRTPLVAVPSTDFSTASHPARDGLGCTGSNLVFLFAVVVFIVVPFGDNGVTTGQASAENIRL